MTTLPDHEALLDGIVKAQRSKNSSKSSRSAFTPPRVDLKQQRYPVLPTITSNSNQWYVLMMLIVIGSVVVCSSDEGVRSKDVAARQCAMPLPAIQQESSHPMPVGANANFMPGVQVLPVLLPWQHLQVPHTNAFDAHHSTAHSVSSRKAPKKELWFKKFKYK